MIRHDIAVVGELFVAEGTYSVLLDNFPVQQLRVSAGDWSSRYPWPLIARLNCVFAGRNTPIVVGTGVSRDDVSIGVGEWGWKRGIAATTAVISVAAPVSRSGRLEPVS
jgi:hypothetical protein